MENYIDKVKKVTFEVIDTDKPEGEETMILTSCVYDAETQELNGWYNKKPVSLSNITLEEWENKACID